MLVLTSQRLRQEGFAHAFFTRQGGVSAAPFDSLSFSLGVGDREANVEENRRRAARELGVAAERLFYVSQVHGVEVHTVQTSDTPDAFVHKVGDIVMTRTPEIACGIRTADCVPVLIADRTTGRVSAVHSGWRGTMINAAGAGARALTSLAPAVDPANFVAAIGPHISVCCFEVEEDVASALAKITDLGDKVLSWGEPSDRMRARGHTARTRRVDLRSIIRAQLIDAGLSSDLIDDVAGCTVCDRELFHSFRRDGAASGRLLSAIVSRSV